MGDIFPFLILCDFLKSQRGVVAGLLRGHPVPAHPSPSQAEATAHTAWGDPGQGLLDPPEASLPFS